MLNAASTVPDHLQQALLTVYHAGKMAGHFSGLRLYKTLERAVVVAGNVLGLLETRQELSTVCSGGKYILCPVTPATTNSSKPTFPDSRYRHPGATSDLQGEPVCCCLPGFPFKVSPSVSGPRPEVIAVGEIAREKSCTLVQCPGGTAV